MKASPKKQGPSATSFCLCFCPLRFRIRESRKKSFTPSLLWSVDSPIRLWWMEQNPYCTQTQAKLPKGGGGDSGGAEKSLFPLSSSPPRRQGAGVAVCGRKRGEERGANYLHHEGAIVAFSRDEWRGVESFE